jgi:hypothetical protein
MLEAMARIAPSHFNEAMTRIALAEMVPFHSTQTSLGGSNKFKKRTWLGCSRKEVARNQQSVRQSPNPTILHTASEKIPQNPPVVQRLL